MANFSSPTKGRLTWPCRSIGLMLGLLGAVLDKPKVSDEWIDLDLFKEASQMLVLVSVSVLLNSGRRGCSRRRKKIQRCGQFYGQDCAPTSHKNLGITIPDSYRKKCYYTMTTGKLENSACYHFLSAVHCDNNGRLCFQSRGNQSSWSIVQIRTELNALIWPAGRLGRGI